MSLKPIREEIDKIDEQLAKLFARRMECSKRVAEYKIEHGFEVVNRAREDEVLNSAAEKAGVYGNSARLLYSTILELSRALQYDMAGGGNALKNEIYTAENAVPRNENIKVACFGVEGTYANQASIKAFPNCTLDFCSTFQDVFSAICSGEAEFGVVPIENSSAGSVTEVYDLMLKYRLYISMAIDIPVNHVLAAKKGTHLTDIDKVYSHQQALYQCSNFFKNHSNIVVQTYLSTAAAAKMVSQSDDMTMGAICSEEAAEKYGLDIIMRGFQDNPNNKTRFIVISRKMYISENSEKISLCFSLPHKTGSLYSVLCRFAVNGLNLTKIESRPISGTDFEYLFYLDFTGNIKDKNTLKLICALSEELTEFSFLGNFEEVIY